MNRLHEQMFIIKANLLLFHFFFHHPHNNTTHGYAQPHLCNNFFPSFRVVRATTGLHTAPPSRTSQFLFCSSHRVRATTITQHNTRSRRQSRTSLTMAKSAAGKSTLLLSSFPSLSFSPLRTHNSQKNPLHRYSASSIPPSQYAIGRRSGGAAPAAGRAARPRQHLCCVPLCASLHCLARLSLRVSR